MFCIYCGTKNDDSSNFCCECGKKLYPSAPANAAKVANASNAVKAANAANYVNPANQVNMGIPTVNKTTLSMEKRLVGIFVASIVAVVIRFGIYYIADYLENQVYEKKVDGDWLAEAHINAELTEEILENCLGFYDSEIAYADLDGLAYVTALSFDADTGRYSIGMNMELTYNNMYSYVDNFMETLYENRDTIDEYMGRADVCSNLEEFKQWYVDTWFSDNFSDYAEMEETLLNLVLNEETLFEDLETGTYHVDSGNIYYEADDENEETHTPYELEDGSLTIEFADGTFVYTRESEWNTQREQNNLDEMGGESL